MDATLGLTRPFSYGRGWPQVVPLEKPAAGKPAIHVVPGKLVERLITSSGLLVVSAQSAVRLPRLRIEDPDGNVIGSFTAGDVGVEIPEVVKPAKPAKGALITYTVPANRVQRLLAASVLLKASAQEATRSPLLVVKDAAGVQVFASAVSGAVLKETSQTASYGFGLAANSTNPKGNAQIGTPELILTGGMTVTFEVGTIQTEDQLENAELLLVNVPAGAEQRFTFASNLGYNVASPSGSAAVSVPDMMLKAGMQLVYDAENLQTEDQLSGLFMYVERWPAGPDGYPQGVEQTFLPPGVLA